MPPQPSARPFPQPSPRPFRIGQTVPGLGTTMGAEVSAMLPCAGALLPGRYQARPLARLAD